MDISTIIKNIIHKNSIPESWSDKLKQEILNYKNSNIISNITRIDLRTLDFITIDEEDAKDFDDAIFCKSLVGNRWNLIVAISDVSYYVRPNTYIDEEAKKRGASIYFPSKVISMLPKQLSNNICSIIPHEDRLCLVCDIIISTDLEKVLEYKFYEAVINSKARLSYNIVWKIWNKNQFWCRKYKKLLISINNLYQMYLILKKINELEKCIFFKIHESKVVLDNRFKVKKIFIHQKNLVHQLIELCMILANILAATYIIQNNKVLLFRVHSYPIKSNILNMRLILKKFNLPIHIQSNVSSVDYIHFLTMIKKHPCDQIIQKILLRSMNKAIYSNKNVGHFGLGLMSYTHFTSPIRRYSDLIIHRIIKYLLYCNKKSYTNRYYTGGYLYTEEHIKYLGDYLSNLENRIEKVTRHVLDQIKCHFLKIKMKNIHQGVIHTITSFGLFVELDKFHIDGLLRLSSLKDDFYIFYPNKNQLIGKKNKKKYHVGDILNVKIIKINVKNNMIELKII
ncbi:ribonuclease R family protein [Buchnera aphidicola]|uniref:ribonuclease R family protein n=1 Tax=Buchnera aphidicola TaxID=9 RepID=UPI00130DFFF2|nr:VacB/RNase II family 3'-5' exoribonuclease [Buchnera aphidicola]